MSKKKHIYVIYDIEENSTRADIAEILLYYGLRRVQYSVFEGILSQKEKMEIVKNIKNKDLGDSDKVHILELCQNCLKARVIIGTMPEEQEHIII